MKRPSGTLKSNKIREIGLKESGRCAQRHRSQQELWRLSEEPQDPGRASEGQGRGDTEWGSCYNFWCEDLFILGFLDCRYYRLLPQIWKRKPTREHHLTELLSIMRESFYLHLKLLPARAVCLGNKPCPQNTKPAGSSCLVALSSVHVLLLSIFGLSCSFLGKVFPEFLLRSYSCWPWGKPGSLEAHALLLLVACLTLVPMALWAPCIWAYHGLWTHQLVVHAHQHLKSHTEWIKL